jgi:hypothetical protein
VSKRGKTFVDDGWNKENQDVTGAARKQTSFHNTLSDFGEWSNQFMGKL